MVSGTKSYLLTGQLYTVFKNQDLYHSSRFHVAQASNEINFYMYYVNEFRIKSAFPELLYSAVPLRNVYQGCHIYIGHCQSFRLARNLYNNLWCTIIDCTFQCVLLHKNILASILTTFINGVREHLWEDILPFLSHILIAVIILLRAGIAQCYSAGLGDRWFESR
jgi:hypothetical protein